MVGDVLEVMDAVESLDGNTPLLLQQAMHTFEEADTVRVKIGDVVTVTHDFHATVGSGYIAAQEGDKLGVLHVETDWLFVELLDAGERAGLQRIQFQRDQLK